MKKIISTVMALSLALSLAGCGGGSSSDTQTDTKAQAEGETAAATGEDYGEYKWTAAMTVAETTTNYKICLLYTSCLK